MLRIGASMKKPVKSAVKASLRHELHSRHHAQHTSTSPHKQTLRSSTPVAKVVSARVRLVQFASLVVIISALGAGCAAEPNHTTQAQDPPKVQEVIDGDTIVVRFPDGQSEVVRLLGVDTPETVDPSRPEQCFGAEASAFVAETLPPGTEVRLERDIEARDQFGRLLAYVFRSDDGRFINAELLSGGYADISIYAPNDGYVEVLEANLTQAKTQSAGLWSACGGPDVAIDPPAIN